MLRVHAQLAAAARAPRSGNHEALVSASADQLHRAHRDAVVGPADGRPRRARVDAPRRFSERHSEILDLGAPFVGVKRHGAGERAGAVFRLRDLHVESEPLVID